MRTLKKLANIFIVASLGLGFVCGCADDQARAALADANAQIAQMQAQINQLNKKIANQKTVDLLNKVSDLQDQVDQINGKVDTISHNSKKYMTTQGQLYASLEAEIQSLQTSSRPNATESAAKVANESDNVAKTTPKVIVAKSSAPSYNDLNLALHKVRQHDFTQAIADLKQIISNSDNPNVAATAMYYLAISYAANGQYKTSIDTARDFISNNPGNTNVPDALRVIYIDQTQLGLKSSANKTALLLKHKYPNSNASKKVQMSLRSNA